ncbi:MFS transporter, partial [Francisella tularensis subsp. holarctica]|nr:MFS transporter [Francisella tularensis subsp. holarctica]
GFIGAKVDDLAAFQGTHKNLDLIKQAQLFQGLFTNIMSILAVTIILWYIVALIITKFK